MEHNKQLIMKLLKPMLGFVAIVLAFEIILFQLLAHGILNTFIAIIIQIIGAVSYTHLRAHET